MTLGQRISNGFELVSKALGLAYSQWRLYYYILAMCIAPAIVVGLSMLLFVSIQAERPLLAGLLITIVTIGALVSWLWALFCALAGQKFVLSLTRGRMLSLRESFQLPWYGILNVIVMVILIQAFFFVLMTIIPGAPLSVAYNVISYPLGILIGIYGFYYFIGTGVEGINFVDAFTQAIRLGTSAWVETLTMTIGMSLVSVILIVPFAGIVRVAQSFGDSAGVMVLLWVLGSICVLLALYVVAAWITLAPLVYSYAINDKKLPL